MDIQQLNVRKQRRAIWITGLMVVIAIVIVLISLNTGSIRLSPLRVMWTWLGQGSTVENLIMFQYRLPRILITILAGIGLGVAGAVLQGVSRNSLADPGILGINAGAGFGLIIFVSFFRTMEGPIALLIPLFTFGGGVLIALVIFMLSYDRQRGLLPIRLILVGIAVAAGVSAITLLLSLKLDPDTYAFAATWLAGSVWGREWVNVWALLPWIALFVPWVYLRSRTLDMFVLGDEIAASLGNSTTRSRIVLLLLAVGLASSSVAMVGSIGFIGLIAPHIARQLVGARHQHFVPVAAMIGMIMLLSADTIGRSIFQPNFVPAGVVVALIGGPYFIYILFKKTV
ncbi:iron ABC transporter permease [Paenibacillus sp. PK4536]|uniref:FecCD family ABC transporter permease n=1 Tax=Paenibacillus TaxID=44249 RepID=UPI0010C00371|nr:MULTISPECIES: iron ABC transporter permease [Paenibacillus]TKJ90285.1 iron ABC transporter permease [Paenibacillus sp. CFBP13512]WIM39523.1 iron ABC transporter permease [Paenibacillus sp. PK4536]CAJ1313697.1 Hemin transport system permease protein HmuU [Paenibacillus nuruki]